MTKCEPLNHVAHHISVTEGVLCIVGDRFVTSKFTYVDITDKVNDKFGGLHLGQVVWNGSLVIDGGCSFII